MGQEWVVLGASVVINCLLKGSLKSLGVVLEELNRHGIDPSKSAWIPAIAYTLFACLSAPVARLPRFFPPRWIALLGGLMASIGMCPSSIPSSNFFKLHPKVSFSLPVLPFPSSTLASEVPWVLGAASLTSPGCWRSTRGSRGRGGVWLTGGAWQETHWEVFSSQVGWLSSLSTGDKLAPSQSTRRSS